MERFCVERQESGALLLEGLMNVIRVNWLASASELDNR